MPAEQIDAAARTGQPVRLHTVRGEVLVARVLDWDGHELSYVVVRSSQPERYAVCDSTGFRLTLDDVERATLLTDAQADKSGRRRQRDGA